MALLARWCSIATNIPRVLYLGATGSSPVLATIYSVSFIALLIKGDLITICWDEDRATETLEFLKGGGE